MFPSTAKAQGHFHPRKTAGAEGHKQGPTGGAEEGQAAAPVGKQGLASSTPSPRMTWRDSNFLGKCRCIKSTPPTCPIPKARIQLPTASQFVIGSGVTGWGPGFNLRLVISLRAQGYFQHVFNSHGMEGGLIQSAQGTIVNPSLMERTETTLKAQVRSCLGAPGAEGTWETTANVMRL